MKRFVVVGLLLALLVGLCASAWAKEEEITEEQIKKAREALVKYMEKREVKKKDVALKIFDLLVDKKVKPSTAKYMIQYAVRENADFDAILKFAEEKVKEGLKGRELYETIRDKFGLKKAAKKSTK
jgi:hypothetical protein